MKEINRNLNKRCGIYMIFNTINGKRYVGSSLDIYGRLHDHISNLNSQTAHNKHLQAAWDKYGQDSFEYGVLEFCESETRFEREQYYIDALRPEYNMSLDVVANFGHVCSEECKKKISIKLKERYASGEIVTYKQQHAWIHCYLYDAINFLYLGEFNNLADCAKYLKLTTANRARMLRTLLLKKYIVVESQFKCISDLKNYVYKNNRKPQDSPVYGSRYLVKEDLNKNITYYDSIAECSRQTGVSKSMIMKHLDADIKHPYVPMKLKGEQIYFINDFIDLPYDATPVPEGKVWELTKNGELCDENTVVTEETKEFSAPYSVEIETVNTE